VDDALHRDFAGGEEGGDLLARAHVVDADEGLVRIVGGAAIDEQQGFLVVSHRREHRAGDGAEEDGGTDQLGAHFQQVFVLDLGAIVGVADDHDEALLPEGFLDRGGDGGHCGVGEIGDEQGDQTALADAEGAADADRAVAEVGDGAAHAFRGGGGGLVGDAVHDAGHGGDRDAGMLGDRGDGNSGGMAWSGGWLGHDGWSCIGREKTIGFGKTFTQREEFGRWLAGEIF